MKNNNSTCLSLLAVGFDAQFASKLVSQGYSVSKLKRLRLKDLVKLEISEELAKQLLKDSRPPISTQAVNQLLYESRDVCCVCRSTNKPIIIHHIDENRSNNSPENLAVLCLNHHGDAHTKKGLSRNLTPDIIKELKEKWVQEVKKKDTRTILALAETSGASWDYINHQRLFELVDELEINPKHCNCYAYLRSLKIIDEFGVLTEPSSWRVQYQPTSYLYQFGNGTQLYLYVKDLLKETLSKLSIIDITNKWNPNEINSLVKPNSFIFCQGAFYFKASDKDEGRNQIRQCYRKANKIELNFQFDAWEATSSSAWCMHLCGHKAITLVCRVKSVLKKEGVLHIGASCLSIGSSFKNINSGNVSELL